MSTEKEERIERLCSGFSLLEKGDQEYIFGILQALLFAKKKAEKANEKLYFTTKEERQ